MPRTLILAAVAALAVAIVPAAAAKEITKAEVCGTGGCTSVDDADGRFALMEGGPPRTPPAAAPYYEVNMEMDHQGGGFSYTAVPDRRAYRADDGVWYEMPPAMVVAVTKGAAHQRAFRAAGLIGAAAPSKPHPAAAGTGDGALWPEGVLIAVVLAAGGVLLVRAARGPRRSRPASS